MSYSAEERKRIVQHICEQVAEGRAVSRIIREDREREGLCSYAVWCDWLHESLELQGRVERARETGATKLLEEVIEISDAPKGDAYIDYEDGKPVAKMDGDSVQRAKLRVYARERYAAMIAPRRYGNKVDVTSGGQPLPAPAPTMVVMNRVEALLVLAAQRAIGNGPMIDVTPSETLDDIMD